jgi:DNA-binding LytR/AlgR family response regulator
MLSVLILETLYNEPQCASKVIKAGMDRRVLPVKRLSVARDMVSFEEVLEEARHNVVLLSLGKVDEGHIGLILNWRPQGDGRYVIFVLSDSSDVLLVARPAVGVSGILFHPPDEARLHQTLKEIYSGHIKTLGAARRFAIKKGAQDVFVNADDIYFFEAKAKKIALKTISQEITFYSNFDSVLEQLSESFIRCHKGFVVNLVHIKSADWRDMLLHLADGSAIPVSRGHKQAVAEALGLRGVQ